MKERLLKLVSVKSIVTVILTVVFSVLALRGDITPEQFVMIFTTVIAFYFGTQAERKGIETNTEVK